MLISISGFVLGSTSKYECSIISLHQYFSMHTIHIFIGALIIVLLFATIVAVIFSWSVYTQRIRKSKTSINNLIDYLNKWNESITTREGAFDFYLGLNQITNEIFHTNLKVLITKDEFDRLNIETIKKLNKEAIQSLQSDLVMNLT